MGKVDCKNYFAAAYKLGFIFLYYTGRSILYKEWGGIYRGVLDQRSLQLWSGKANDQTHQRGQEAGRRMPGARYTGGK